jgi:hypothetical protein
MYTKSMQRPIKFRFRLKADNGTVIVNYYTLEQLHSNTYVIHEVLSRDEFTGLQDTHNRDVYENDVLTDGLFRLPVEYVSGGFFCGDNPLYQIIDEDRYWVDGTTHNNP